MQWVATLIGIVCSAYSYAHANPDVYTVAQQNLATVHGLTADGEDCSIEVAPLVASGSTRLEYTFKYQFNGRHAHVESSWPGWRVDASKKSLISTQVNHFLEFYFDDHLKITRLYSEEDLFGELLIDECTF